MGGRERLREMLDCWLARWRGPVWVTGLDISLSSLDTRFTADVLWDPEEEVFLFKIKLRL